MGIQFSGLASGLDTNSIISDLMKVERMKVESIEKEKVLAEWRKEAWEDMNSKLYSFYKEELFDFKSQGTYSRKSVVSSNTSLISMNDSNFAARGSHSIDVTTMAKGSFLTSEELVGVTQASTAADLFGITDPDTGTLNISLDGGTTTHEVTFEATDTLAQMVDKIKDLDLDLDVNYDTNFNRLFLSSTETGKDIEIQVTGDEAVLDGLGFTAGNRIGTAGDDAAFTYNGTSLTSASNEISINGLSFNILSENDSATITVTQDTDAIYESVKSFVLKYNAMMIEMNGKLDADSVRGYDPLTDEEKSAMSEEDIKLWEDKIKSSLLRRDDILSNVTSNMRSILTISSGVDTTGFQYKSLSDLGILTGGYQEKGLLHIAGDEDDSLYSDDDNKLKAAIEDDPDAVMELMTALGDKLYSYMNDKMKSSSLSSALTFYNDKFLTREIGDYEEDIFDLEDRLVMIEERYYKQFTAMEQAIQQSNSTSTWLAQQLGGM